MTRNRNFVRGAVAIRAKRVTTWIAAFHTTGTVSSAGGLLLFSLGAVALALRPFTIVRSRFIVQISSDQQAATETQAAAFGMAVVSDAASAVGVTAMPTPVTEMSSDFWFVHQNLLSEFRLITAAGFMEPSSRLYEIDSKAMRKVDVGEDVVGVIEADVAAGGGGSSIDVMGRFLIKNN